MALTVHEAKRTRTTLEEALTSAAEFLARYPEQSALAAQAQQAATMMKATVVGGKEADAAPEQTVSLLRDAVGVGRSVITQTDAGRKVPRLTARIEEAERLLGTA